LNGTIGTIPNMSLLRAAMLTLICNFLHNVFLEDRCQVALEKRT